MLLSPFFERLDICNEVFHLVRFRVNGLPLFQRGISEIPHFGKGGRGGICFKMRIAVKN